MEKYVQRDIYLQKLIDSRLNGDVKVVTGPRRCGKSWLLTRLYKDFLIADGVSEEDIIIVSLDLDDENNQSELTDKDKLKDYLYSRITNPSKTYYVMLDEIQEVEGFEKLVNGLRNKENVDVYVTGSNAKLLSKEISTIFRDRGHEIRCNPFSFKEFCSGREESLRELWQEYYTYGGMPGLRRRKTRLQKAAYLQELWRKTYMTDIRDRYPIENEIALEALADGLCSSIGSLSNSNKMANSLKSIRNIKINEETVKKYLDYICDSFLFEGALRFNIKGKEYYKSFRKYYCVDLGLRNARLNFRQQEITHIMENIIYNELRARDYMVDVGVIESREMRQGKSQYIQYEVDFIATNGIDKYYIQSAYALPTEEKREQEFKSLKKISDSFQKIVIVGDDIATYTNTDGIIIMGLFQFLMNTDILK
ncbi:MAG: ATP-binding protein [Bacteroidaceae bacterium]|nr:ATP-binding protein [Bacteroidaceae bacterium]